MKMKRILAVALSTVMIGSTVCVTAYAEEEQAKPYRYVALGDSVSAGFGLETPEGGDIFNDPALLVTDELLANPVQGAYPAVYGEMLSQLCAEYGYSAETVNLSACAYSATDTAKVIREEGYIGTMANWIFYSDPAKMATVAGYHDLFVQKLTEADLVSIGLGGNDIIMAVLAKSGSTDNVVVKAISTAVLMQFMGYDTEMALGAALMTLQANKDKLTAQTVIDAVSFIKDTAATIEESVDTAATETAEVINAVREVNSEADIALVGMFNPFGNSLEYNGQTYNLCTVAKNIVTRAMQDVCEQGAVEQNLSANGISSIADAIKQAGKDKMTKLAAIAADEISYPLQYLFCGKTMDPFVQSLNEKLEAIADEKGCVFVDVYDISNGKGLDPHPDAAQHREIAEILAKDTKNTVLTAMGVEPEVGDADGNGNVTINDATFLQRFLAEYTQEDGSLLLDLGVVKIKLRCDVNRDGRVDINDVTALQRILAEIDNTFSFKKA